MIRKLLLPALLTSLLAGCASNYYYRDAGHGGGYYYGDPSVDYDYYDYGFYGYGWYGYGWPYYRWPYYSSWYGHGHYGFPYAHWGDPYPYGWPIYYDRDPRPESPGLNEPLGRKPTLEDIRARRDMRGIAQPGSVGVARPMPKPTVRPRSIEPRVRAPAPRAAPSMQPMPRSKPAGRSSGMVRQNEE
jgi:hypothetical protein